MKTNFTQSGRIILLIFVSVCCTLGTQSIKAQWLTNGTMVYYNSGNVGIGTSSPAEKLHIAGSVRGNVSGALRISTGNGYIDIGPQNSSFAHINTDRDKFYMSKPLYLNDGKLSAYNTSNLYLQTNGTTRMTILNTSGLIGIGTTNPTATLTVNGGIKAERVDIITDVPASDFVFEKDYHLMDIQQVEAFILKEKHLPEVPSAAEFKENGYSVGKMDDILLRKIEQLTLYIIDQNKRIEALESELRNSCD